MDLRAWYGRHKSLVSVLAFTSLSVIAVAGISLYLLNSVQQNGQISLVQAEIVLIVSLFLIVIIANLARARWNRLKQEIGTYSQIGRALSESERKFRDLVENAPVGIIVSSFDGTVVEVNSTLVRMHGYASKEEFIKSPVSAHVCDPKDREHWVGRVWDSGKVEGFEHQAKRKDGSMFWASITAIPRTTESGEQQLVAVVEDITRRKGVEGALLASERRYRSLFAHMLEGYAYCRMIFENGDPKDFEYLEVNQQFEDLTGLREAAGKRVSELIPGINQSNPELFVVFGRVARTGRAERTEIFIAALDTWFSVSVYGPKPDHFVAVFDIITDRKRAAAALADSEAKFRTLAEDSPNMIFINKGGRIVYVNRRCVQVTGYSPEEFRAPEFDFRNLLIPPSGEAPERNGTAHQKGSELEPQEYSLVTRDGTMLKVLMASRLVNYEGSPAILGTVTDMTSRKQMEQQIMLQERLASIGEVVSGVAHELNDPLTGVIGFSQLVLDKELTDEIRADISIISSEAQRAARVVKNLLTFARQHVPVEVPTQLNNIMEEVLRLRAYEQTVKNIEVIRRLDPRLPEIQVDPFQIQQVFFNIVVNAEYFMTETHRRGVLTVTTEHDGGVVRVLFADDGPGIRPEHLSRIFNPFFTTKEAGKGTGLGLSIAHGIVSEHGGKIYARSDPGRGATFVMELPASAGPETVGALAGGTNVPAK